MNPPSIALCCNFYNDAAALRGLLESGSRYFDNLFFINSGPGGAFSTDGSIELIESFGGTVVYDDIQKGYGAIRTRLIHDCGCEWAFILDADERFYPQLPVLHCEGTESYPQTPAPKLVVTERNEVCNQGEFLKRLISDPGHMSVRTTRRHWFDYSMRKPSQNWLDNRDHQLRIVRNHPEIGYQKDRVMHERLLDNRTGKDPVYAAQDDYKGPFHDHFHLFYRRAQPGKKEFNEQNYSRLERGEKMILPE